MTRFAVFILGCVLLSSCVATIARNRDTYTVEVYASLARQQEAAAQLFRLAEDARVAGDTARCAEIAAPALLIEQYADNQAKRALWLAGLTAADPGEPPEARPISAVCGGPQ